MLAYTHIYEIRKVIEKNWEKFKPALIEKKRFDVYMDRIEDFRNAPMHSRELLPFERDLLSGIVGEIRNLTTLYRSRQAPDRKHYPIVESIVDSFGVEAYGNSRSITSGIRLKVGERVEFSCRGWGAQGRILKWRLWKGDSAKDIDRASGNTVTLRWIPSNKDVGEHCLIHIEMSSDGKYRRMGDYDFDHLISYAVEPPE